ncbi:unnamed protein product [Ixodes hexagonus]
MRTAMIRPSGILRYTPLGVFITRISVPGGISTGGSAELFSGMHSLAGTRMRWTVMP